MLAETPLPHYSLRHGFEDGLIDSLVSEELEYFECLDAARLVNLYSRYRASPESLEGDEKALVYASLSLARYIQLRRHSATGPGDTSNSSEDVTYFRMAREALKSWGKASITSICTSRQLPWTDTRGYVLPCQVCSISRKSRRIWRDDKPMGVADPGNGIAPTIRCSAISGSRFR
jgi:hypothetical protein